MSIKHLWRIFILANKHNCNGVNEQVPARENARHDLGALLARLILNANALKIRTWFSSVFLHYLGTATLPMHQPPIFKISPFPQPLSPPKLL